MSAPPAEEDLHELVTGFVRDHGLVLLICAGIFAVVAWFCHAQLRRLRERDRLARELEDALVQNAQGLILNVHGIVKNLSATDPMRQQVEQALDRADEQLSEDRDRVQDLRALAMLDGEPLASSESRALPTEIDPPHETNAATGDSKSWKSIVARWLSSQHPR